MASQIRFGDYLSKVSVQHNKINYNQLTPKPEKDSNGKLIPIHPKKLTFTPVDIVRLLKPYLGVRIMEQLQAVIPLGLYLALFQILMLRQDVTDSWVITMGLGAVIIGLMLFMEGLKLGLMPFGEVIGNGLPKKSPLPVVLLVAFLLGIGVTFAEPAIGALQAVGASVDVTKAPYLYTLLNDWSGVLVLMVGAGVGLAAVLGALRFLRGWSLKPMIYMALIPTLLLTSYMMMDPELAAVLGLAWDCGAVTTGPVTVPLVLSLGIGIASASGKGDSSLSGFGIVTLASLFPIIAVLLLTLYVSSVSSADAIIQAAQSGAAAAAAVVPQWYEQTPMAEVIGGVRAIVPLVIFLVIVLYFVLKEKISQPGIVFYGIFLAVTGMIVFSIGLSYGLAKLGGQSGGLVPAAFSQLPSVESSPLYDYATGVTIALAFAWLLGFGATLAEPALNALGMTVENLTNGAFKKSTLMYAVSFGVACGIATGVFKIIYNIPIASLLIPAYIIGIIFTYFSTEEFVNVAWDSAGVTTGPVTVPLVLAMGLGFGNAVNAVDGFGILSMASIGPILSVMAVGLWIQFKARRAAQNTLIQTTTVVTGESA
ncbi:MAG: DUF1538 domain-containing protein [Gammaproteobacteria bacterium]|jgi:hypothetical protein|nr:DUF1538 domain-containing protein [Gammaproteobacteria bacterium]MBT3488807.1 DUF1538 domain-containing protein [Gammaproteobacteria bacterium]MBT3718000.1 DUF1538 domain-containing protein [Gammaproteobacteria bacterium]MBT3844680.1 DUF1538 domain-containing protein [Gammaproteobacteria bacterium]MBT3892917.1 DUF1538 domain-containing protein [Gammaproteobacteria bacterium]